ncbi:hypothetical protein Pcinc_016567 [Petrolisthes cinctipes]|uniref:Pro-Pol polyprotein n=1 Tax=Petrolisthes cinctipes TaxID=88211 RepID=A0AAE1KQT0_PETCI|nr:hypothetical protein Pcinc_016567 [Petrolisthes cinctipes]
MADDDKQMERRRAANRGWVTRTSNALADLVAKPDVTTLELEDAIEEFDRRLAALDDTQSAVEMGIVEPDKLEKDIEDADRFRRQVRCHRVQASQKLADLLTKTGPPAVPAAHSDNGATDSVMSNIIRLPRIELPKFSGNVLEWLSFWEQFEALVGEANIPAVSKFGYLLSSLEGEAKRVVHGLTLTAASFPIACKMLKERFGKSERIIFAHIQALLNIEMPVKSSGFKYIASLWKMQDELNSHIRSLEALGVKGDQYGVVLTPVILSRLPQEIRMEWSRDGSGHEGDLHWLMSFLQNELERRERSDSYRDGCRYDEARGGPLPSEKRKVPPSTASALVSSSSPGMTNCIFCGKQHPSEKCFSVKKLTRDELVEKLRTLGLCFRCLEKGHISRGCKHKCSKCQGYHNVLFCLKGQPKVTSNNVPSVSESVQPAGDSVPVTSDSRTQSPVSYVGVDLCKTQKGSEHLKSTCCVLQTAKVRVINGEGKSVDATVLFDTGSDRSYVSKSLVKNVRPTWLNSEPISYSAFGNNSSQGHMCNLYDLRLEDCKGLVHSLVAVEINTICAPLIRPRVPEDTLRGYEYLPLADDYLHNQHINVDILVGVDSYWKFMLPNQICLQKGLVAQECVFGWVLSGSWTSCSPMGVSTQLLCVNGVSEASLSKFWDLESVGVTCKEALTDDSNRVQQTFTEHVKFVDGRYEVTLPWKSDTARSQLQDNVKLAKKRLSNLCHRFQKDPRLKEEYDAVFRAYEKEGICEEVPPSQLKSVHPTYYLPHRPVVRESSSSTKIRPVFDASAARYNGVSLNDCLDAGPSLNPDLVETLLRFRRWQVAFTADISKAFLQINVREDDRDVHRFLWQCGDQVRTMRFLRVPFGNKSSPFLLNATIKHHLQFFSHSEVVQELKENLYVDDWLSGADSIEEGKVKFTEACSILAKAGMTLTKWSSNSKDMVGCFGCKTCLNEGSVKVLGMQWEIEKDCFSFANYDVESQPEPISTKRAVLSCIARLFDPIGFVSPFIMYVKILFQDIWKEGGGWDEILPDHLLYGFQRWFNSISLFKTWSVKRCYTPGISWKDLNGAELHAFGDASEKGYGACVYLRVPQSDGKFSVSFVMSRGRVSPIKSVTLPRLELIGALLCARLVTFVESTLHINVPVCCWTDSTVTLSWIKGEPLKWKSFVRNRVSEIQELTSPSNWRHCPGRDNPADLISRGALAEHLMSSELWLNGPAWLSLPIQHLQHEQQNSNGVENCEVVTPCLKVTEAHSSVFEFSRYSGFCKAVNVVAWVLRFIRNCKSKGDKDTGQLTYEELSKAKVKLFQSVQLEAYSQEFEALSKGKAIPQNSPICKLDPFIGDDGLLRVKGRLEEADMLYESKHPIIIPSGHVAQLLIRFQHILLKHAGVSVLVSTLRSGYWIVRLRRMAKSICNKCVQCRRHHSKACSQSVAPLPASRVTPSPPFTVTGLDFAGPLFCVDKPSSKFYILLFTCAVVRAIHLELTDSLSMSDCTLALRRFVARRGLPSVFYSDNAKTFVGVSQRLKQIFGPLAPNWKFTFPRAPWWGGWWERLIRSVKLSLRKTLGVKCLYRTELETTLHEIEAYINSRPLTYVGEEYDSALPLTPSHFLIGRPAGFKVEDVNEASVQSTAKDLSLREKIRQQQLDKFWELWSNDYIRNLPPTVKGFQQKCKLKEGSLVLIKEDNIPRMSWPCGIVLEVFPGKDGLIRGVTIKTAKGIIQRPIQKLHDLEIQYKSHCNESVNNLERGEDVSDQIIVGSSDTFSRKGRKVKPPQRLNL